MLTVLLYFVLTEKKLWVIYNQFDFDFKIYIIYKIEDQIYIFVFFFILYFCFFSCSYIEHIICINI